MIANDIYEDVRQATGFVDLDINLSRMSDAIEVLNNKGNFDATMSYLTITPAADIITLPSDVKEPIRINISNTPSLPRDRIFEFSLNGPGNAGELVGWQWVDRGEVQILSQPATPMTVHAIGDAGDNAKTITVTGRVDNAGTLDTKVLLINGANSGTVFRTIETVSKEVTTGTVTLLTSSNVGLDSWLPAETGHLFRQIRISKSAATAYIFFRRRSFRVASLTSFIPIRSRMAVILMVQAYEGYRRSSPDAEKLEMQAVKLANEEQASSNSFITLSSTIDVPTCRNQSYAAADTLIAADCFDDACTIFGGMGTDKILDRMTEATQALAAKANFDATKGYLTIPVTDYLVTLPGFVDVPLDVNIDDHPAFARTRGYEFSINGPGSVGERLGWQWEDRGMVPVTAQPEVPEKVTVLGNSTLDAGKIVTVIGTDAAGAEMAARLDIGTNGISLVAFAHIDSVIKDVTTKGVSLQTEGGQILAFYAPADTIPSFRQIRVSKKTCVLRMLVKQKASVLKSLSDPLLARSRLAVVTMMRALKEYRGGSSDEAKKLEEHAGRLAAEEEVSHNSFIEENKAKMPGAQNLNYNNVDSIIAADLFDDACEIFGEIGTEKIFDKMSEAKSLLSNKHQWESDLGWVDILTDQYNYVTLPRYVDVPISVNINGHPTVFRNRWFQFHLNGPGECTTCLNWTWEDASEVVTLRDVPYTIKLLALPDLPLDDEKVIWIYGFYQGKRIQSQDTEGKNVDGFPLTIRTDESGISPFLVDRITRIVKPKTAGFVKLVATDLIGGTPFTVGYYYPDETEPKYRRIKISRRCARVRIMYRMRETKITAFTDPIHLRSKLAMTTAMRAMTMIAKGDPKGAGMEDLAVKYLLESQAIRNQKIGLTIEADPSFRMGRFMRS